MAKRPGGFPMGPPADSRASEGRTSGYDHLKQVYFGHFFPDTAPVAGWVPLQGTCLP